MVQSFWKPVGLILLSTVLTEYEYTMTQIWLSQLSPIKLKLNILSCGTAF